MQKQAPSVPRVLVMVLFALSCFGLLLFLWVSFGGPIPLKPNGYQFKVNVPEATQLGLEPDVREAGVTIGKVVKKDLAPGAGNATTATVEVDAKYAPIRSNANVILRQKTLLGETYLEITPGTPSAPAVGGFLKASRVSPRSSSTRCSRPLTRSRGRRSATGSRTSRRRSTAAART